MWQVVFSTEGALLIPVEDGTEEDIKTDKSKRHFRLKRLFKFQSLHTRFKWLLHSIRFYI
jgi:hypothetical protein